MNKQYERWFIGGDWDILVFHDGLQVFEHTFSGNDEDDEAVDTLYAVCKLLEVAGYEEREHGDY